MKHTYNNSSIKTSRMSVTRFGGIVNGGDTHQLQDAKNLILTERSMLCTRGRRATLRPLTKPQGIYGDDTLAFVDNGKLYYGGLEVTGIHLSSGEKQLLRLGKYILILPDEVYFSPANVSDCGALSVSYTSEDGAYVCCVDAAGNEIINYGVSAKEPDGATIGEYCAIKDSKGYVMKYFDGNIWDEVDCMLKITAQGIGAGFEVGDTVHCSGLGDIIGDHFRIAKKSPDALYFQGVVPSAFSCGPIVLQRIFPSMDFCAVSGGRIYGVRRGTDKSGELVSRIYASAENDPLNFSPYGGGLCADVDISGVFTAIGDRAGQPVAFSESDIVELYIKNGKLIPTVIKGYGVERGASKSLVCNGGILYYKGSVGVCAYDGSYPECISSGLGGRLGIGIHGAPAVCVNGKYYINLADTQLKSAIYIYDIDKKLWLKEDAPEVLEYAKRNEICYALCTDRIMIMNYDQADENEKSYCAALGYPIVEDKVSWSAELGQIFSDKLMGLIPVALFMRLSLPKDSEMSVSLENGQSTELVGEINGIVKIPLVPNRAQALKLCFSGNGDCQILGYSLEYREGGEISVWK